MSQAILSLSKNIENIYQRYPWSQYVLVFIGVLLLYMLTSPRIVALEDDTLFTLTSYYNGVAHPPGYPLFTFIGHLFTWLPIGSIAYRVHLVSAFFGAATVTILSALIMHLTSKRMISILVAFICAVSDTFWSQSIISEVYTLNTFFFILIFWLTFKVNSFKKDKISHHNKLLYALACIYGLSIANHWPLIVLSSFGLALMILPYYEHILKKFVPLALFLIVGLLPYVWMIINSNRDLEVSFYSAIESFEGFIFFILRKGYVNVDNQHIIPSDKWNFFSFMSLKAIQQYTAVGFGLAVLGIHHLWQQNKRWFWATLFIFISQIYVLIYLVNFKYTELLKEAFSVYPLIAYLILALYLALGANALYDILQRKAKSKSGFQPLLKKYSYSIVSLLLLFILIISFYSNFEKNNRSEYSWSKKFVHAFFENIEPNSILFINDDFSTSIAYYHKLENIRPDVTLYNSKDLFFKTRLSKFMDSGHLKEKRLQDFIKDSTRPIYYTGSMDHPYKEKNFIFFRKILKNKPLPPDQLYNSKVKIDSYFVPQELLDLTLTDIDNTDTWTRSHKHLLIEHLSHFMSAIYENRDILPKKQQATILKKAIPHLKKYYPHPYLQILASFAQKNYRLNHEKELKWISEYAEPALKKENNRLKIAVMYYVKSIIYYQQQEYQNSITNAEDSLRYNPDIKNPSFNILLQYYAYFNKKEAYFKLRNQLERDPKQKATIKHDLSALPNLDKKMGYYPGVKN